MRWWLGWINRILGKGLSVSDYRELLLGCGHDRKKRLCAEPHHPQQRWQNPRGPVTLDVNKAVNPDLWCDLNSDPPWFAAPCDGSRARPEDVGIDSKLRGELDGYVTPYRVLHYMESDYWDEIHAYEVLEHLGRQGDAHAFFRQMSELWRILKPDGYLVATVPSRFCGGLWGDPGHARAIVAETLVFLDQSQYIAQCDHERQRTTMTDYRGIYHADFRVLQQHDNRSQFAFVLQAVKPSRWVQLNEA